MQATVFILFVCLVVGFANADIPDPEWADAHRPVVECSVSLPAAFDPLDPYAIVTYSNTSDRCPAYEYVPVRARERVGIGPDVSFDGTGVEMVDSEYDSWPAGEVEIPPLSAVSITYRIGDKYKIHPSWALIRVRPVSQNYLQYYWFEFDRSGRLVSNGTHQIRSYAEMVSNTWSDIVFREHVRSDIRRYAELRAKGEATLLSAGQDQADLRGEDAYESGPRDRDREQHGPLLSPA